MLVRRKKLYLWMSLNGPPDVNIQSCKRSWARRALLRWSSFQIHLVVVGLQRGAQDGHEVLDPGRAFKKNMLHKQILMIY